MMSVVHPGRCDGPWEGDSDWLITAMVLISAVCDAGDCDVLKVVPSVAVPRGDAAGPELWVATNKHTHTHTQTYTHHTDN